MPRFLEVMHGGFAELRPVERTMHAKGIVMNDRSKSFSTRAIHHGYNPMDNEGALTPPLHLTSTFAFESAEAGGEMFAGERPGYIYSRISNPTLDLLERRIGPVDACVAWRRDHRRPDAVWMHILLHAARPGQIRHHHFPCRHDRSGQSGGSYVGQDAGCLF